MKRRQSYLLFTYRIYPTVRQVQALELHLREACRLYNAALQERRDAWTMQRKRITFYSQNAQLTEIRQAGDLAICSRKCAEGVLRRVDFAFAAFFRRARSGDVPGYPRFKSWRSYDSLSFFPWGNGIGITRSGRLHVLGIGDIKLKLHRPILGEPKSAVIRRQAGRWHVALMCAVDAVALPPSDRSVGVDVGLSSFAVLSDGTAIPAPRYLRASERKLKRQQRHLSRCQERSNRRLEAVRSVARAHVAIRNQRADFHHKLSRNIVNHHGLIAVEDLNIKGLVRTRLAKSIHDAGWASFLDQLSYKAENAGREFVRVNPAGTSQTCLCGASVPKLLKDRWHSCPACGLEAPRDLVSAQIIQRLGLSRQTLTEPLGAVVCGAEQ